MDPPPPMSPSEIPIKREAMYPTISMQGCLKCKCEIHAPVIP
jgi:hypothetical protein